MQRVSVSSSNIRSIGYESESKILEIEFNSGSIYQYYKVPEEIYQNLMNAGSHGRYFRQNIKNTYAYTRIR